MKFGIFYEHQLPRPWEPGAELRLFQDALDQVELADRLGIDYAWEVEHHFLEEYSHSSAPEVFLAAASQRSRRIRLGHGIVLMPPGYNAPARVAAPPLTKAAHRLGRRRSEENNRGVSRVDGPRRAGGHVARGAGIACSHVSGRLVQSGGLLAQGEFRASMTRNPTPLS